MDGSNRSNCNEMILLEGKRVRATLQLETRNFFMGMRMGRRGEEGGGGGGGGGEEEMI